MGGINGIESSADPLPRYRRTQDCCHTPTLKPAPDNTTDTDPTGHPALWMKSQLGIERQLLRRMQEGHPVHAGAADQLASFALTSASTDSAELLVIASTNFLDANDVIAGIDTADLSGSLLNVVETMQRVPVILDRSVNLLDNSLAPAQSVILANSGSLSSLIDQLFFAPLNQQWVETSESILGATQAFDDAVAERSLTDAFSAQFQLLGLSFGELIPLYIAAVPVTWLGNFIEDVVDATDFFDFAI